MKKIITLVLIAASLTAHAQKEKRITPAYFISGALTSADSFNRFLLVAMPDMQLKSMDSSKNNKWDYDYKNGNKDVKITYYIETGKSKSAKNAGQKSISHVELRSDFITLAKLYDRVVNSKATPGELLKQLPIRGPIYYGYNDYVWNKNSYWFSFAYFEQDGYCMLFRKIG